MAEGRQIFRFRLPWVMAPTPQPAPVEPLPQIQPTATIPIMRPPFQPQAPAPAPTPTPTPTPIPIQRLPFRPTGPPATLQPQAPLGTQSQPTSPSTTAPPSQVASLPLLPPLTLPPSQLASQPLLPPLTLPPSRVASQPPSPPLTPPPSRVASPQSPFQTAPPSPVASPLSPPFHSAPQSRVASQPSSPSLTASQAQQAFQTASQPSSPPRTATQLAGQIPLQPPSPHTASQVQPTTQVASQPPSPSKQAPKLQPTTQASSQPPSPSKQALQLQPTTQTISQPPSSSRSSSSQYEPLSDKTPQAQQTFSQPLPQEPQPQPQVKTRFEPVSNFQNQTPMQATSQIDEVEKQAIQVAGPVAAGAPTTTAAPETPTSPQKSPLSAITVDLTHPQKSETKSEEIKEEKQKTEPESKKEERPDFQAAEEPKQSTFELFKASGFNKQTRWQSGITPQAERKQPEKQEVLDEKEITTTRFEGRERATLVTTHPKDRFTGSESRKKSIISTGERSDQQKDNREDVFKFINKLAAGQPNQPIDQKPASVITLAGENKGATMHLASESGKREGPAPIDRCYKLNKDDNPEVITDGEDSSKGQRSNKPMTREDLPTMAYINSNIQTINNSILHNISITERNPGVHMVLSRNPTGPAKLNDKTESIEAHKADFNITPALALSYEPTVGTECLRCLTVESSDSDAENPEKSQDHDSS